VGQRRGLGVAAGSPRYVVRIEPDRNRVVVGSREEALRRACTVRRLNWIAGEPPSAFRAQVQVRYRHAPAAACVALGAEEKASVRFDVPQFGVAPGQVAAFYDGDELLGGGWIV